MLPDCSRRKTLPTSRQRAPTPFTMPSIKPASTPFQRTIREPPISGLGVAFASLQDDRGFIRDLADSWHALISVSHEGVGGHGREHCPTVLPDLMITTRMLRKSPCQAAVELVSALVAVGCGSGINCRGLLSNGRLPPYNLPSSRKLKCPVRLKMIWSNSSMPTMAPAALSWAVMLTSPVDGSSCPLG